MTMTLVFLLMEKDGVLVTESTDFPCPCVDISIVNLCHVNARSGKNYHCQLIL